MGRKQKQIDVSELITDSIQDAQPENSPDAEEYFLNFVNNSKASGIHSPLVRQLSKLEAPNIDDVELIQRVRNGDKSGNFLLLCKHYKYILAKVIEATNGTWFSEDIFQAGIVGLYEAVLHYDMKRKNKFLTYAHYWILKFIYIEIRNELLPIAGIGVGRDTKERLYNYIKYKMQGFNDEEIMEKLHVKQKQLDDIKMLSSAASRVRSLNDVQTFKNGNTSEVYVKAESLTSSEISVEDLVETKEFMRYLEEKVNDLAESNAELALFLNYEFGFSGFDHLDKGEMCSRLKISSKHYELLHKEGAEYLKKQMEKDNWYTTYVKKEDKSSVWEDEEDLPQVVKKQMQEKAPQEGQ